MTLKIDNELKEFLYMLTPVEFETLKEDVIKNGCREPIYLATYPGSDGEVILDGHNRYEICSTASPQIPFKTVTLDFDGKYAAILWMYRNQRGRRNWNDTQKAMMGLKAAPALREEAARRMRAGKANPTPLVGEGEVNKIIAKESGVSHHTVDRVKYIQDHAPLELLKEVLDDKKTLNQAYLQARRVNDPFYKAPVIPAPTNPEDEWKTINAFSQAIRSNASIKNKIQKMMVDVMCMEPQLIARMTEPSRSEALILWANLSNHVDYVNKGLREIASAPKTDALED